MNKSCRYCGKLHTIGYVCTKKPVRAYDRDDINAAFRRTNKWRQASVRAMRRDFYLCRNCLARGIITTHPLSVHHIVPLSEDFSKRLDDDNLITLCDDCHRSAEARDITRAELVGISASPPRLPYDTPPG